MVKVYDIIPDVNVYQSLLAVDENIWGSPMMSLDCTPKADTWIAPEVYCLKPKLKRGDFLDFHTSGLTATPEATEKVLGFFEMAGEVLPLPFEGAEFSLLNVTECINCLDADKSGWLVDDVGERILVQKYVFYPDRLTESSLFKIPEMCRGGVLTYEISGDPEEEFKAFVESEGLTGLIFKELWRSE